MILQILHSWKFYKNYCKSFLKYSKRGGNMDNSSIIISVVIVLCIAAGVTAYGLTNDSNSVFTDL